MPFFSETELAIVTRPTPKQHIEEKQDGNKKVKYVTGSYVKAVLNELFDYNWQETIVQTSYFPAPNACVVVHIRLTATTELGRVIHKEQFGGAYVEKSLPFAYKAAATDALKKCASEIGLFSDVYTDDKPAEEPLPQDDPLVQIEMLRMECIESQIEISASDKRLFTKTVNNREKGNYEKCIFKLNAYIAKTKKQN